MVDEDRAPGRSTRRGFLIGAGSFATGAALGRSARAADMPQLQVILETPGGVLRFDAAAGRDLGDFAGPGFTQRCILTTLPDQPFRVMFRPDRDSDRLEVVVELGGLRATRPIHARAYPAPIRPA